MLQHIDFRPAVVLVKLLDSHFAAHYQYKCKTFLRPSEAVHVYIPTLWPPAVS